MYAIKSFSLFIAIICITSTTLITLINGHDFLAEKPIYLKTCTRESVKNIFKKCLVDAFQNIFTNWAQGVANSTPIDPLTLSHLLINEDRKGVRSGPEIMVKVLKPIATGLASAKVLNMNMKENNDYSFKMRYFVPSIIIRGNYRAMGQISLLQLDTTGDMLVEIRNGVYTIATKVVLRKFDDSSFVFFDLKALKFVINEIENVRVNFSNLFKDEALTKNTNIVFNEQWRVFFDTFKPRIEHTISPVLLDALQSIFAVIPAEFFVADVKKLNVNGTNSTA